MPGVGNTDGHDQNESKYISLCI